MHPIAEATSSTSLRRAAHRHPILDATREAELLGRIREYDDQSAMAELLAAHYRMVVSSAVRYARDSLSIADLVSEGNLGLVIAARKFDPTKSARFSTYAALWIRARMGRFALANRSIVPAPSTRSARTLFASLRKLEAAMEQRTGEKPSREALATATGTSVSDIALVQSALSSRDVPVGGCDDGWTPNADAMSAEELLAEHETCVRSRDALASALTKLSEREHQIVRRRYWGTEERIETLEEIGRDLGLSRERVRQIEAAAKRKLAATMQCKAA